VRPDAIDLELLVWLTELRFALATQIHRRVGDGKSYSTTQRRLKKLSQAGWVQRFQFFLETGASSALTSLVTQEGMATVKDAVGTHRPYLDPRREWSVPSTDDPAMRRARHDLHVNAWVLASLPSAMSTTDVRWATRCPHCRPRCRSSRVTVSVQRARVILASASCSEATIGRQRLAALPAARRALHGCCNHAEGVADPPASRMRSGPTVGHRGVRTALVMALPRP
jgi:hypothetical protein